MKERIAVIGCGIIAGHYRAALDASETLELVAVHDLNEHCAGRDAYRDVPFYTDLDRLLAETVPTVALVATPSDTHYDVVREMLERSLSVIVEKPMAATIAEIEDLFVVAERKGVRLQCMFHWTLADEVVFLKEYLAGRDVHSISVCIKDNYTEASPDGTRHMKPSRIGLAGAWADSGINALSYVAELLPMGEIRLLSAESETDEICGYDYYVHRRYLIDGVEVTITVDWRGESRDKTGRITVDGDTLEIDHNEQSVVLCRGAGCETVFHAPTADRLGSHYLNYLRRFAWRQDETAHTLALHRILTDHLG